MSTLEQEVQEQTALDEWREGKETRAIVTPYAFSVDKALLGRTLAKPWQRGLAMALDLLLVAMLTEASEVLIALVAAVATWQIAKRHDQVVHRWARGLLRSVAVVIVFGVTVALSAVLMDELDVRQAESDIDSFGQAAALSAASVQFGLCKDMTCVHGGSADLVNTLAETLASEPDKARELVPELVAALDWASPAQRSELEGELLKALDKALASQAAAAPAVPETPDKIITLDDGDQAEQEPSLIAWAKGIITDLGLGLSWAALYFTLFTTWWRGRTPGKRLLGIRVVQLDNGPITLWGAFGRYGGYGAGLATGLMGFLQILWDPNRQAIQDKVSGTVVIQGSGPISYTAATQAETKQEERL
ncbi:RDD family protein [Gallaecimonas sp. GXIMD4217]|uniref:RDD family protein n=1 Tax=Gallaecimonas sp. GXIMD4217 TaxID=3131927 RepID=UPI00311AFB98